MRLTRDFDPINPGESEVFTFDFVNDLPASDTIASASVTLAASVGSDPQASSRLVNAAQTSGTQVLQRIGGCLGGVVYLVSATVLTTQGNTLTLWAHLPCQAPF